VMLQRGPACGSFHGATRLRGRAGCSGLNIRISFFGY
jgi:hypothetical protein